VHGRAHMAKTHYSIKMHHFKHSNEEYLYLSLQSLRAVEHHLDYTREY
jgi:hypothetical protein